VICPDIGLCREDARRTQKLAFEDMAVNFTLEQWVLLDSSQKNLQVLFTRYL
jgi:hypothetical protein